MFEKQDYKNILTNVIASVIASAIAVWLFSNTTTVVILKQDLVQGKNVYDTLIVNKYIDNEPIAETNNNTFSKKVKVEVQNIVNYYAIRKDRINDFFNNRNNNGGFWNFFLFLIIQYLVLNLFFGVLAIFIAMYNVHALTSFNAFFKKQGAYQHLFGISLFLLDWFLFNSNILSFITFSVFIFYGFNIISIIFTIMAVRYSSKYIKGKNILTFENKLGYKFYNFFAKRNYLATFLVIICFISVGYINYILQIV